ncbi:hypothetical protein BCY91_03585 [Pelobium manganitolerans]|uniref:Hemerythrin-like domain-containing protein n=1 Tax=Pelobium manganitolerans TaxID=1842495 RepID=A0A419S7R8_9SPHI|nr:hemerythrin domain-containing protein [Pelobium manganitolerans]RKD17233.1 hypothetical protein BCY91_03585 [Pelobium manganitolerans]
MTLHQFFTDDHHRIDGILEKATEKAGEINLDLYYQFRAQLLRHIKMEEKILFPAAKKANPIIAEQIIPRYRLEHGAITALMVPPPTALLVKVIRYLVDVHDLAEEQPGGLYEICEELTQGQTEELLNQLKATDEVPLHLPNPAPIAMQSAIRALRRAGYDYDEIVRKVQ